MTEKQHPGYKDYGNWVTHPEATAETLRAYPGKTTLSREASVEDDALANALYHRVVNGYRDPISGFIVVDAVLHSFPRAYLRAPQLSGWLNMNHPRFIWDSITVGRILAGLADEGREAFGEGNEPILTGEDSRGRFYVLREPSVVPRLWLMAVRRRLGEVCQTVMRAERFGDEWRETDKDLWQYVVDPETGVVPVPVL